MDMQENSKIHDLPPAHYTRRWLRSIEAIKEADRELSRDLHRLTERHAARVALFRDDSRECAEQLGRMVPDKGEWCEFIEGLSHEPMVCRLQRDSETGEVTLSVKRLVHACGLDWPDDEQWSLDDFVAITDIASDPISAAFKVADGVVEA